MVLGKYWHNDWLYMGKKGFDGKLLEYTQTPILTYITALIVALVFSGFWKYDYDPKKKKK